MTPVFHISAWHEDNGPVCWWKFPVVEPPYCGTPLDDDFPDYVTHWTVIEIPEDPGDLMNVQTETLYKVTFGKLEMEFKSLEEALQWMNFIRDTPIDDGPADVKLVEWSTSRPRGSNQMGEPSTEQAAIYRLEREITAALENIKKRQYLNASVHLNEASKFTLMALNAVLKGKPTDE